MNAILAVVTSQRIQDFIESSFNAAELTGGSYYSNFYIGLTRVNSTTFQWPDGTFVKLNYVCEMMINSRYSYSSCVAIVWSGVSDFTWYAEYCYSYYGYICQRRINTTTAFRKYKKNHETQSKTTDNLKNCKTPSWVIPVIAILSATVVSMLALVLYLWKSRLKPTVPNSDVKVNMHVTQESSYADPIAITTVSQPEYEDINEPEAVYEEFDDK
uniref:uncharacterized protein LOC113475033 n=1 Tax=Ciona intestinalis TaxID=7719 RepID=UPI000EF55A18|nr:uncharacterized protein LOC113475033 [Ciona intestinalis]|eukprot:XP_026694238.1 uncharacterized protein LOC113475033 [Ciona intestinalis]